MNSCLTVCMVAADLPSPPEGAGSSSSQPSSPKTKKPANELDDFMARFEALKRK